MNTLLARALAGNNPDDPLKPKGPTFLPVNQTPVITPEVVPANTEVTKPAPSLLQAITTGAGNALADPNVQQLLMNLGSAIGGQGSVASAIGGAGTTLLQGALEAELTSKLLSGENTGATLGDSRFNSLSPEARGRAQQALATQNAEERADTELGLQAEQVKQQGQLNTARVREIDSLIQDRDDDRESGERVAFARIESAEQLAEAEDILSRDLAELQSTTQRSIASMDNASRQRIAELTASAALQEARIRAAVEQDNQQLQRELSSLQYLTGNVEGLQSMISATEQRLSLLSGGELSAEDEKDKIRQQERLSILQEDYNVQNRYLQAFSRDFLKDAGYNLPDLPNIAGPSERFDPATRRPLGADSGMERGGRRTVRE